MEFDEKRLTIITLDKDSEEINRISFENTNHSIIDKIHIYNY